MRSVTRWLIAAMCVVVAGDVTALKAQQVDPVYDEDSKLVSFEDLAYPPLARAVRVQGVVVVSVTLDDEGSVTVATPVSGSKVLIPPCLDNARKWKFVPNRQKRAVIVYEFRIHAGACHDRSSSVFLLMHNNFASIVSCNNVIEG
jgi:TonB family protein